MNTRADSDPAIFPSQNNFKGTNSGKFLAGIKAQRGNFLRDSMSAIGEKQTSKDLPWIGYDDSCALCRYRLDQVLHPEKYADEDEESPHCEAEACTPSKEYTWDEWIAHKRKEEKKEH
jgi:hypothetical protein